MQNLHYNIFRSFLKYFCINILSKFFIKVTLYWHLVNDTLVLSFIFVYFQYVYVYFVSFLTFFCAFRMPKTDKQKRQTDSFQICLRAFGSKFLFLCQQYKKLRDFFHRFYKTVFIPSVKIVTACAQIRTRNAHKGKSCAVCSAPYRLDMRFNVQLFHTCLYIFY